MAVQLRRPLLIGGLTLSFGLWLMQSFDDALAEMGELGAIVAIALGVGWWMLDKPKPVELKGVRAGSIDRDAVDRAIASVRTILDRAAAEAAEIKAERRKSESSSEIERLRDRLAELSVEGTLDSLTIALVGAKGTGKTKLQEAIARSQAPDFPPIHWLETPALLTATNRETELQDSETWKQAIAADLVVFLTRGDLTESEYRIVKQLHQSAARSLVVWNQCDRETEERQATILQSLRDRLSPLLGSQDAIAIAASPNPVKVRQHRADGSVAEKMETRAPQIAPLQSRLEQIWATERQQLHLAKTYREAIELKREAQTQLNQLRRDRALPIVEKYQYIAAAAAFANPVAALDLLATSAVSAQLIADLGEIYQQNFSLDREKAIARALAEQLVKLGIVELSSQTVAAILKSHAVTYIAGGVVQGISAAYLTRLAGLSLIEYFQAQDASLASESGMEQLANTVKAVFEQNRRMTVLRGFVEQVVGRLAPEGKQSASLSAQVAALQENRSRDGAIVPNLEPTS
jgi:uncharacterized protein (DUF697 family)